MRKIWEYFDIFLRLENERRGSPAPHPQLPNALGDAVSREPTVVESREER
jgi:hypothetical protein